jgi:hypothetical protein
MHRALLLGNCMSNFMVTGNCMRRSKWVELGAGSLLQISLLWEFDFRRFNLPEKECQPNSVK